MAKKNEEGRSSGKSPRPAAALGPAVAAVAAGAFLYFRDNTVIWGVGIPHYTGLILAFVGVLWIFYTLSSPK